MVEAFHVYRHSFQYFSTLMYESLKHKKLILASKSPRRKELLGGLDLGYEVRTKEVDESFPQDLKREQIALYLSNKKADAFLPDIGSDEIVITADTIVWIGDQVLNKPSDKMEAVEMLKMLSGNHHTVFTGVCLVSSEKRVSFFGSTDVWFKELNEEEIEYYIEKYKPFDKAGSYGVQEWIGYIGIDRIDGCFYNVMGLPLNLVYKHLMEFGHD